MNLSFQEILQHTQHRPWELPAGPWSFYQEWNRAVFLHYPVDASLLRPLVPKELTLDLWEGQAWVSAVAFTMEHIRPRFIPAFSPISNFEELNIRTYVKMGSKTGVYFLSIEAGNKWSCQIARAISALPYRHASMKRNSQFFRSENALMGDRIEMKFEAGEFLSAKTELDRWLTERYALFQETPKGINQFEIQHVEWPIQELKIHSLAVDYPRFKHLISSIPAKVHYSAGVQVLAWSKQVIPALEGY